MKRLSLSLLVAAAALGACADPTSTSAVPDVAPSAAVVVAPCAECAYGDVRFTRTLGVRYEQADFTADPAASWVLVVTDDGAATTGAEVLLNGVQRVSRTDLLGAGETEVRIPVTLQASNRLLVRMHGPLGASAVVRIEPAPATALVITPDPVERLPGGTQQFSVTSGGPGPYTWSVNGIDGGNATFGTISATGFYTAPATVPTPATFQVCARRVAAPAESGCATVTINPIPTAGEDIVVINDMNWADQVGMANANNQQFVRNLVNFTTPGPRSSGTAVIYDRGRNSPCFQNGECGDASQAPLDAVFADAGYTVTKNDGMASYASIPANVKLILLFNPRIAFTPADINGFKQFASQGGRIVWIGEWLGFYGAEGIAIQNQFMEDMGAQLTNIGDTIDCGRVVLPGSSLRAHQLTAGLTEFAFACGSRIVLGPNDFAFLYDSSNSIIMGALAKIDVTPLPVMAVREASVVPSASRIARTPADLRVTGVGTPARARRTP